MRDWDPVQEQEFFDIFRDYYDLEQTSGRKYTSGEYTLDRMTPLAELAGNPEDKLRVLHVAGTKGKGSTALLLTALLRSAQHRCGTFTSPHLATVRERFQIDNQLISYEELIAQARAFEQKLRVHGWEPSLFEIMTILSLQLFVNNHCKFAVLETGIGGLLDATNYVSSPECCVITPVSVDHTHILGKTISEIAAQKAGIIKPDTPIVCSRQPFAEAEAVIRQQAKSLNAPFYSPVPATDLEQWPLPAMPPFMLDNLRSALQVCNVIGVTPDPKRFVIPEMRARSECICHDPLVVIDGSHNADSAQKLVESMRTLYPKTDFTIVLGCVKGKDAEGIFQALLQLSNDFILTNPHTPKGSELDRLVSFGTKTEVSFEIQPTINSPADLPPNRNLLFTGSFFTALIGEKLFNKQ